MLYVVRHITEYRYGHPASLSHNQARLRPRDTPRQRCLRHAHYIEPEPSMVSQREDYFGNHVSDFFIPLEHSVFRVTAESDVQVKTPRLPEPAATTPWEKVVAEVAAPSSRSDIQANQFIHPSSLTPANAGLRAYAMESFTPNRPILDAAMELNARVFRSFRYDKTATHVNTPVMEVFAMRRGVCQDFAHLMISCLRSIGLAARYVSGYLRTLPPPGRARIVGADASHAWLSLFVPPDQWIDLDPTNNQPATDDYVTLAWGRDYSDVAPLRGVFLGGGAHSLRVSVDVAVVDDSAERAQPEI